MITTKLKILLTTIGVILLGVIIHFVLAKKLTTNKPHIIIIIADDVGINDVGYYGSSQIPTPNLDALAYNGIILDKFYTQNACTPSRAALLTGNYPLRYGLHIVPILPGENRSLPHTVPIMSQHFKNLGYKTHLIGKWHLGAAHTKQTPIKRGFDNHFGYWHGYIGYFDYKTFYDFPNGTRIDGLDFHNNLTPDWSNQGKYATEIFTEKTLEIIDKHKIEEPLFLVVSHLAGHTGENGTVLGVPDQELTNTKFSYIKDPLRRSYADVIYNMDKSIGEIIQKLSKKKMLENSIIFFFSDNGAPTNGVFKNAGSNWPLRGIKMTEFEGGIRTPATIFSPLFQKTGYINKQLMHLTDILPTLYVAAAGDLTNLGKLDGVNQWETISKDLPTNRSDIIVNINEFNKISAIIDDWGKYKYISGIWQNGSFDHHTGENGRGPEVPPYDINAIINSPTNQAIQTIINQPLTEQKIIKLRTQTDLTWCRKYNITYSINCLEGCLFNLDDDPCETTNIINDNKDIEMRLEQKLKKMEQYIEPQAPLKFDPKSNPKFYNNTWHTWLDN